MGSRESKEGGEGVGLGNGRRGKEEEGGKEVDAKSQTVCIAPSACLQKPYHQPTRSPTGVNQAPPPRAEEPH